MSIEPWGVYPASHPVSAGIGSSTPAALCRISSIRWMNEYYLESKSFMILMRNLSFAVALPCTHTHTHALKHFILFYIFLYIFSCHVLSTPLSFHNSCYRYQTLTRDLPLTEKMPKTDEAGLERGWLWGPSLTLGKAATLRVQTWVEAMTKFQDHFKWLISKFQYESIWL